VEVETGSGSRGDGGRVAGEPARTRVGELYGPVPDRATKGASPPRAGKDRV